MKSPFLVLLLLCVAIIAHSQESPKYQKAKAKMKTQEGYVVDKAGNTITGLIVNADGKPAGKVSIMIPNGETRKFGPDEATEYGLSFYRFISTGNQFLQVVFENKKVGIYKDIVTMTHYSAAPPGGMPGGGMMYQQTVEKFYVHRPGEDEYKKITKIIFAKSMSEYFADCPVLSEKLKNRDYSSKEESLREIASFYDRECKTAN